MVFLLRFRTSYLLDYAGNTVQLYNKENLWALEL